MIIGLIAVGMVATVLIHLLGRRQPAPIPFGETAFLAPVNLRERTLQRLQQPLLLILRLALLGLIAVWLDGPESAQDWLTGSSEDWQSPRVSGTAHAEPALLRLHHEKPTQAGIADHWREGVTTAPVLQDVRVRAVAVDAPRWQAVISLPPVRSHPHRDSLSSAVRAIAASGAMDLELCGADCDNADIAFVADGAHEPRARWQVQLEHGDGDWTLEPIAEDRHRLGLPETAGDDFPWRLQQVIQELLSHRVPPAAIAATTQTGQWRAPYPLLILLCWLAERLLARGRR